LQAIGAADNWRGDEGNNEGETGVPGDRLIDDDGEQVQGLARPSWKADVLCVSI